VDGACFTVVAVRNRTFEVDVGPESLNRTVAGSYRAGRKVNLERALQVGARLGGHFVLGHVDGLGVIRQRCPRGQAVDFTVEAPPEVLDLAPPKGSIAVDGISLTVNQVSQTCFDVSLIPHTQERTTLGHKHVGDSVNLETDLLARTVAWLVRRSGLGPSHSDVTEELLHKAGFL
jgi:riboflavin synthase